MCVIRLCEPFSFWLFVLPLLLLSPSTLDSIPNTEDRRRLLSTDGSGKRAIEQISNDPNRRMHVCVRLESCREFAPANKSNSSHPPILLFVRTCVSLACLPIVRSNKRQVYTCSALFSCTWSQGMERMRWTASEIRRTRERSHFPLVNGIKSRSTPTSDRRTDQTNCEIIRTKLSACSKSSMTGKRQADNDMFHPSFGSRVFGDDEVRSLCPLLPFSPLSHAR